MTFRALFFDQLIFVIGLCAIAWLVRWARRHGRPRRWEVLAGAAAALQLAGMALALAPLKHLLADPVPAWVRGLAVAIGACACALLPLTVAVPRLPEDRSRRRLLYAAAALPSAVAGFAIVRRNQTSVREVSLSVPGLPPDLAGLRIVQLSDIHLSPFLEERDLARIVDQANETRAHLAVVTGDLITVEGDPLDACLRQLQRLRSEAGTLGCLGNHEIIGRCEDEAEREGRRRGIDFLRGRARVLRFGDGAINIAGVDYQRIGQPYLLGAEKLLVPGMPNVLLSHQPDLFPVAASQGWDITLAGHTHGGQINVEIGQSGLNMARVFTPYVYGVYREANRSIYVTRGIGTVGVPARIGAPPEVALISLCAT